MAYSIHITRKKNWIDKEPEITNDEWKKVVDEDNELYHEEGNVLGSGDTSIPIITWNNPETGESVVGFYLQKGNINIDGANQEIIKKAKDISKALNARVQGDDSEFYD